MTPTMTPTDAATDPETTEPKPVLPVARPRLLTLVKFRLSRPDHPPVEANALVHGDGYGAARVWQEAADRRADALGVPRVSVMTLSRTPTTQDDVDQLRAVGITVHEFAETSP